MDKELGKIKNKHQDLVASFCNGGRLVLGFCWLPGDTQLFEQPGRKSKC